MNVMEQTNAKSSRVQHQQLCHAVLLCSSMMPQGGSAWHEVKVSSWASLRCEVQSYYSWYPCQKPMSPLCLLLFLLPHLLLSLSLPSSDFSFSSSPFSSFISLPFLNLSISSCILCVTEFGEESSEKIESTTYEFQALFDKY